QVTDTGAIGQAVDAVLAQHADKVAEYRSGKDKLFGFFVGQVMKATAGKANPQAVNELLPAKLAGCRAGAAPQPAAPALRRGPASRRGGTELQPEDSGDGEGAARQAAGAGRPPEERDAEDCRPDRSNPGPHRVRGSQRQAAERDAEEHHAGDERDRRSHAGPK